MTYAKIQELYRRDFNKTIKTCWIADVKRQLGLTKRKAFNRINKNSVKYPCVNVEVKDWLLHILKS